MSGATLGCARPSIRSPAPRAGPGRRRARLAGLLLALGLLSIAPAARAQDIEPRSFSNTPVGTNFLVGGYAFTRGSLAEDPSVPLTNSRLDTSSLVLGYVRAFGLLGMSAKFDVAAPVTWLSGSAVFAGQPFARSVQGLGDPRFRVSVNLLGAPALTLEEFADYRQGLILGASLQVSVPAGQYDRTRLVNLGTNRWSFKPELGLSQRLGPLTLEATAAATFYTTNPDFFGGSTRAQEPVFAFQGHAIVSLGAGIWGSLDATYFLGGRTRLDGEPNNDRLENWRVGATLSLPIHGGYSLRLYGSRGVSARTGNNYDLLGIALQYRWGGGL